MAETSTYRDLKRELAELLEWFEQDDIDIDEAMKNYERAASVIKQLEKYLDTAKLKVSKLSEVST